MAFIPLSYLPKKAVFIRKHKSQFLLSLFECFLFHFSTILPRCRRLIFFFPDTAWQVVQPKGLFPSGYARCLVSSLPSLHPT